jgi:hypothetical protein
MADETPNEIKPIVEALDANQAQIMEMHKEQNNLYGTIRVQEEQTKQQINSIKELIHKMKKGQRGEKGGVKVRNISVPWGMGQVRNLSDADYDEYIQTYLKQLEIEENKLKALVGQRQHRGDEVGENRLKILRMFWYMLVKQHGFKDDELYEHCRNYMDATIKPSSFLRTEKDVNDTIKKAQEIKT